MKIVFFILLVPLIIIFGGLSCDSLKTDNRSSRTKKLSAFKEDGQLKIKWQDSLLLAYQYDIKMPPDGVPEIFKRSGYIHPINTPAGKRLTRIHPPDHHHHYGLWNPWTRVEYLNDTIDFWNLGSGQATIRHVEFQMMKSAQDGYTYKVKHEHVILGEKEIIPFVEYQTVTIKYIMDSSYVLDFKIDYEVNGEAPVKLVKYRYGGFGWRTTEEWNNQNSEILTSAGLGRKEADGSLAKWFVAQGKLGNDYGGILLMSNPLNYNYPEPLRVWPSDMYKRGDLFVNFATTKYTDWVFSPGETYTLRYRLYVYDGKIGLKKAEELWNEYLKNYEETKSIPESDENLIDER